MSFKQLAWISAIFLVVSGCGKAQEVKLSLSTDSRTILIPDSTSSCSALAAVVGTDDSPTKDISRKYFALRNPVLFWSDPAKNARIFSIRITFRSPYVKGNGECVISGDELQALFAYTDTNGKPVLWDGTLTPGGTAPLGGQTRFCSALKCGGTETMEGKVFQATGQIEVYGVSVNPADNEEIPFRYLGSVQIENLF